MTTITLYRYEREQGKVTVSTNKPDCKYTEQYRIIADKDKLVTNDGTTFYKAVDVESTEGWREVELSDVTKN